MSINTSKALVDKNEDKQDIAHQLNFTKWAFSPEVSNTFVLEAFKRDTLGSDADFTDMVKTFTDATNELIKDDSMEYVERLLLNQSIALNGLFVSLACKASGLNNTKEFETFLRLAMKAQSQSRATLETLSAVKNPPVYARTANIAQNQQINNGASPAPQKTINSALTQPSNSSTPNIKKKQEVKP